MQKREAKFQSLFNKWVKSEFQKTAVFELKQTVNERLPFSRLEAHQANALWHAKHHLIVYKLPDCGFQNPCDSICLRGVSAYVVIRYPQFFCLIDIDVFVKESEESEEKSLTSERAKEIAEVCVNI